LYGANLGPVPLKFYDRNGGICTNIQRENYLQLIQIAMKQGALKVPRLIGSAF
jgi:hypothetical protein